MTGFFLVFGLIYECFSHGVYAPAMYLAFLIPLLGGLIPSLILWGRTRTHRRGWIRSFLEEEADAGTASGLRREGDCVCRWRLSSMTRSIWDAAVLTLTLGSLMSGVLTIYGTSNRLILVYWLAAGGLMAAALLFLIRDLRAGRISAVSPSAEHSRDNCHADRADACESCL